MKTDRLIDLSSGKKNLIKKYAIQKDVRGGINL